MNDSTPFVDHPARRLTVTLPLPYDEARTLYENLVPAVDFSRFYQLATWDATLELAEINAPHGFMRYHDIDVTAIMASSPSTWRATRYSMGNHTIAERMFRHDPAVMLHAPMAALLYADDDGDTKFAVEQPSVSFGSYQNHEIDPVAAELDALVAQLIIALGATVPPTLARDMGPGHVITTRP